MRKTSLDLHHLQKPSANIICNHAILNTFPKNTEVRHDVHSQSFYQHCTDDVTCLRKNNISYQISNMWSVSQFSHSVVSDSLWPHESQHARAPFIQTHVHRVGDASSHLILCCPLLLLPPIPPSIRVFSNESTLHEVANFKNHLKYYKKYTYLKIYSSKRCEKLIYWK